MFVIQHTGDYKTMNYIEGKLDIIQYKDFGCFPVYGYLL